MTLNLSNLKPAKGSKRKVQRVGRGGKRGSYSGRGMKGQRARSGGKRGLKALGFKQTLQRIPKVRGFKSLKPKLAVINLEALEKFNAGEIVDLKALKKAGLVAKRAKGVKVLGRGELTKKLTVFAQSFSHSAKEAIIKAGGQAEIK